MKTIHLICNAHLDPVWLWEWEEGAAEALSTFRVAAEFCENENGFIFNHNEVILYQWVQEYEPALFKRIQKLVKEGKWHIMGGWFLQPDCNMPCGESFVRQILLGREYFKKNFGVRPKTAINFDPFGHSRGLVQILAKSGFDSYLVARPNSSQLKLPNDQFVWEGFDGSTIMARRADVGYNTLIGTAREKIENYITKFHDEKTGIVLWGIGNHGGGPSKIDLGQINELIAERDDVQIKHSTPEAYFEQIKKEGENFPVWKDSLNPFAVGCYTSQIRIKQAHRKLESELFSTEKMLSVAAAQQLIQYPHDALKEAMQTLATSQFHDILPGSSIDPVEKTSLRLLDYGLEILSKLKARAFFALCQGQPKCAENHIPIMVYNPHPYPITCVIECEYQLQNVNEAGTFYDAKVFYAGKIIPSQIEQELSNIALDWRKRIIFSATLEPSQMNRFDCRLKELEAKPKKRHQAVGNLIQVETKEMKVAVNTQTGLIESYSVNGENLLGANACQPRVFNDSPDPWAMTVYSFGDKAGVFRLMSPEEAAKCAGVDAKTLPPVQIVESGDARTIIEAFFVYDHSFILMQYKIPEQGSELEIDMRVYWNQKDQMLKLAFPLKQGFEQCFGQTAFGYHEFEASEKEQVAQKWVVANNPTTKQSVSIINDGTYGLDYSQESLQLSLLRSSAYSAHPIPKRALMPQNRFSPRSDQGERHYHFWLNGGPTRQRLQQIEQEALTHHETPKTLSFFPSGNGDKLQVGPRLDNVSIQMSALKQAEDRQGLIVRFYNSTGQKQSAKFSDAVMGIAQSLNFGPFEVKTYRLQAGSVTQVNMIEESI